MRGILITYEHKVHEFSGGARELHDAVGGYIEAAPCNTRSVTIWCNEDGKMMELPINALANFVWSYLGDLGCQAARDYLVGNVVITGPPNSEGETQDLGQRERAVVMALIGAPEGSTS